MRAVVFYNTPGRLTAFGFTVGQIFLINLPLRLSDFYLRCFLRSLRAFASLGFFSKQRTLFRRVPLHIGYTLPCHVMCVFDVPPPPRSSSSSFLIYPFSLSLFGPPHLSAPLLRWVHHHRHPRRRRCPRERE